MTNTAIILEYMLVNNLDPDKVVLHTYQTWKKLGYQHASDVAKGNRNNNKGLHFKFIKDENGNYIYDEETALRIIHNDTIFEM